MGINILVNENDEVIGTTDREIKKGEYGRGALVCIVNTQGEMLVAKRSEYMSTNPNKWGFSAAGHVDQTGDYEDTAVRETFEELGFEILKDELQEIAYKTPFEDEARTFRKFYLVKKDIPTDELLRLVEQARQRRRQKGKIIEVADVRWVGKKELAAWMQESPSDFSRRFPDQYKMFEAYLVSEKQ